MNFRRLVSAVAALAVAGTMCAGLAVTASAETTDLYGTLVHTASQVAGSTKRQWTYTLDQADTPTGLNTGAGRAYAGYGYIQMELPDLGSYYLDSAELSIPIYYAGNGGDRDIYLYSVSGFEVTEGAEAGTWAYTGASDQYADVPFGSWDSGVDGRDKITIGSQITYASYAKGYAPTSYKACALDVTSAIEAAYEDGDSTITFAVASSNQGPTMQTSGITLTITVSAEEVVKTPVQSITVNYMDGDTVVATDSDYDVDGLYVGDTMNVPFRAYVEGTDGVLYESEKYSSDVYYYVPDVALTEKTVVEIDVSSAGIDGDVVILDDLDGDTSNYANVRASYASSYNNKAYTSAELEPGIYTIILSGMSRGRGSTVTVGDTTLLTMSDWTSNSWYLGQTIEDVEITTSASIVLNKGGDSTYDYLDMVIAVRTGDLEPKITSVNVETATGKITAGTTLTTLSGNDLVIDGTEEVTTYTILVANGDSSDIPTLVTPTTGAESLTPTGEVTYGYAGTDGYIFIIQTIGIDTATEATLENGSTYTITTTASSDE